MVFSPLVLPIPVFLLALVPKLLLPWVWGVKEGRLRGAMARGFIKSGWGEICWWTPKLSLFGVVGMGGREWGRVAIWRTLKRKKISY